MLPSRFGEETGASVIYPSAIWVIWLRNRWPDSSTTCCICSLLLKQKTRGVSKCHVCDPVPKRSLYHIPTYHIWIPVTKTKGICLNTVCICDLVHEQRVLGLTLDSCLVSWRKKAASELCVVSSGNQNWVKYIVTNLGFWKNNHLNFTSQNKVS